MNKSMIVTLALSACTSLLVALADEPHSNPTADDADDSEQTQGLIGLSVEPLHPSLTSQLPEAIGKGRGILISHVSKDSPADKSGLQVYDILVTYDNQRLYSPQQFAKLVRNDTPGRTVKVGYVRHGEERQTNVILGEQAAHPIPRIDRMYRWPVTPPIDPYMIAPTVKDDSTWSNFESMKLTRVDEDHFKVTINFRTAQGKSERREFAGTREEIRNAVVSENGLPVDVRDPLFRALGIHPIDPNPNLFRVPQRWEQELLDWPRNRGI